MAIFLIWITYGTLNFHDTDAVAGVLGQQRLAGQFAFAGGGVGFAICVLLLLGACGKSAQFPLHVWLPDAMEGPTPVSALIHAATMVTAGVYMVTRCTPLFMASPDAQLVVACVGGITAILAGLIALTQFDLKRVLAYSTVSQLGYMFLALGTGTLAGITAGMFHLFTHAFFKALLFLGAGSVMHSMGNVIDMRRFSGLRHIMPKTHLTFAVGCLALAGIFPLAGFWSKDAIVASVHDKFHSAEHDAHATPSIPQGEVGLLGSSSAVHQPSYMYVTDQQAQTIYRCLYYVALFTALLTAIYTFRAYFMTFFGDKKVPEEAGHHAHESPPAMWVPLAVLAVFAAGIGAVLELTHVFANALGNTPSLAYGLVQQTTAPGQFHMNIAIISTIIAVLGAGVAAFLYLGHRLEADLLKSFFNLDWTQRLAGLGWVSELASSPTIRAIHRTSEKLWLGWLAKLLGYVGVFALFLLCSPLVLAHLISPYRLSFRKFFFDEIYSALIVWPLRSLASLSYAVDRWLVDGVVNLFGKLPVWGGGFLRSLQTGLVPFYGLAMVLGMLTVLAARVIWGGN